MQKDEINLLVQEKETVKKNMDEIIVHDGLNMMMAYLPKTFQFLHPLCVFKETSD